MVKATTNDKGNISICKKKKKVECVLLVKEGMKNGALFLLGEKKVTLP